jgi:hypothetical protein
MSAADIVECADPVAPVPAVCGSIRAYDEGAVQTGAHLLR